MGGINKCGLVCHGFFADVLGDGLYTAHGRFKVIH